jgi:ssDNA-binding replication factor A large subunit
MSWDKVSLKELRPGMEHLDFKVKISRIIGIRTVKTFSGIEHRILEGEFENESGAIGFAVWNEKIELFTNLSAGDKMELRDCFITSFRGVLQVNVGRDSNAKKVLD